MDVKYLLFDRYVYRTPLLELNNFNNEDNFDTNLFNEAIFLASPDFYREKQKSNCNYDNKMKLSLYKYLTRSSTRCTPFGLFAGCSVGKIGDKTNIELCDMTRYQRVTRLDMNYMCALIQNIESKPEIRKQLKFYTNDSIYQLGGVYRYVEYYYKGVTRVHKISSVEISDYLTHLLDIATNGKYFDELANELIDDDISYEEAAEFIEELIDSQLLKSELEITVTGNNPLNTLIEKLEKINNTDILVNTLQEIGGLLNEIDASMLGESIDKYDSIIRKISELNVKFDAKYLFQTDMFKPSPQSQLSDKVTGEFNSLIEFLNKITPKTPQTNLSEFRKAYYERYEEREMPLLEVLDTELGIGYLQNGASDVPNELIANIPYRVANQMGQSSQYNGIIQNIMLNKYMDCVKNGKNIITVTDEDVSGLKADWNDLPNTISIMCNILENGKEEKLVNIRSIGGSSAANLLGRFCHLNKEIESLSKEISAKDRELTEDKILAEIVHLPESRIGNILFRPVLRDYELHYLANSEVSQEYKLSLSDLYISVKGGRIILRSKRLNKEIVPRLTTAHNYSFNSLPAYHFLCDMQAQNLRGGLYFIWDSVFNAFEYKPRVMYKNFILSTEQWFINSDKIKEIDRQSVKNYICENKIPQCVIIADGDNEQFIDFNDDNLMDLFISMLKKRKRVWVSEFLFNRDNMLVKSQNNNYFCNEFIFPLYKTDQI